MLPEGGAAPAFGLPSAQGGRVGLKDLLGTPIAVIFVRQDCPHCEHLLSEVAQIQLGPGRQIIVVSAGGVDLARAVRAQHILSATVLADPAGATADAYSVTAAPCAYLVDARGRIEGGARGLPGVRQLLAQWR